MPTILSTQEVNRLLECVSNTKHIVLLFILYGGGLRLNEVISMQVNDIWWDRNQMLIRSGKGNKDRVVMLSQTLKQLLRKYFNEFMPQQWLFEGQDNQTQYSERSVQNVVKMLSKSRYYQKSESSHFTTLFRDAPPGCRHSIALYPDITRSQGRKNNDDIHSCHYPKYIACCESIG